MSTSLQTDEGALFGRGLAFPPHIGRDGRWAYSAGARNIEESIRVILMTELKERIMLPEFGGGLRSFLFEPNTPATHRLIEERISKSLARWEPRIKLASVDIAPDRSDPEAATITVEYRLVATSEPGRTSLTIRLS